MIAEAIFTVAMIAVFCADMALTWRLLVNYRKQIREGGAFGAAMFKSPFYGHLVFACARIVLLALVASFMGWLSMLVWSAVTLYAVINNLIVMSKLKS